MKTRYTTADLFAAIHDLQPFLNLHCQNVYDIDSKTYLFKFHKPEGKAMILVESGMRIHPTEFEWPKNPSPSSFSMKLRKHIKQKRLKSVQQLGMDRIVDLQFGEADRACHVIAELYDRGNLVLTDHEYVILNILRPRTDRDTDVRFSVKQKYPVESARQTEPLISLEDLSNILDNAKKGDNLRKILNPKLQFGPALLEHALYSVGLRSNAQIGVQITGENYATIYSGLEKAESIFQKLRDQPSKGYVIVKNETKVSAKDDSDTVETVQEFHPLLYLQFEEKMKQSQNTTHFIEFESFGKAVDSFFSRLESTKIDTKALQQERNAMKKLENIKKDHEERLNKLQSAQSLNESKAGLIEMNKELVDKAIHFIRLAVANQLSWEEVEELVKEGKEKQDPVASAITSLQLDRGQFILSLSDPFSQSSDSEDSEDDDEESSPPPKPVSVEIDMNLNAYQNARKYFDSKKQASVKQQKTMDASKKALKSAELKTQEMLQQVQIRTTVQKQRKTFWFEKFLWFISSDRYLVIGGRDAQQNELLVKKYLRPGDVYVHADLRGASSVIVKNKMESEEAPEIPPKTLSEAGQMSVCYSAAWEAKVVAGAWWVRHDQVSKTAPSGEYLTPGSFMIRGKKNFLPSAQLVLGFGYFFKLDDESTERRAHEAALKKEIDAPEDQTQSISHEDNEDHQTGDEESEAEPEFPDVALRLNHLSSTGDPNEEYEILQLGPKRPDNNRVRFGEQQEDVKDSDVKEDEGKMDGAQAKRGQKHKRRKAKQKYKDQDEEERMLRMELLASSGNKEKKNKKSEKGKQQFKGKPTPRSVPKPSATASKPGILKTSNDTPDADAEATLPELVSQDDLKQENEEEEATEAKNEEIETKVKEEPEEEEGGEELLDEVGGALAALCPTPVHEDGLLFALPVCAPYSALSNFKFKVKINPGMNKKGKAIKTAIQIFIKDKEAGNREKDLMKASMDQDLSRNVPSKIKVSAPNLQAIKNMKKSGK